MGRDGRARHRPDGSEIAVVATYDDLPQAIVRYGGSCDRVELSIPVEAPEDESRLAEMVTEIQSG